MGDKVTGAAGPVFVTLAIVLISSGVFCFCESSKVVVEVSNDADQEFTLHGKSGRRILPFSRCDSTQPPMAATHGAD